MIRMHRWKGVPHSGAAARPEGRCVVAPCVKERVPCVEGQPGSREWQHSGRVRVREADWGAAVVWENAARPLTTWRTYSWHRWPNWLRGETDVLATCQKCDIWQSWRALLMISFQLELFLWVNSLQGEHDGDRITVGNTVLSGVGGHRGKDWAEPGKWP